MSLGRRVFTAFLVFIIVPLFVLGTVSYLVFQHITQEKYTEQLELSMNAIGRNINNMIREANYFSDFWVTTKDSVESVDQSFRGEGLAATAAGDDDPYYQEMIENEKLSQRVLLTYPGIKSVSLYRENGGLVNVNFIKDTPFSFDVLKNDPIYQEVLRKNGSPVWIGPNEDMALTGPNNLFTQIRVLLDIDTLKSKGILVIRFSMNELDRTFEFYNTGASDNRRYLIVGRGGTVVYDSGASLEGQNFYLNADPNAKLDLAQNFESVKMKFLGQKSLVSVHNLGDIKRLGVGDWTLVTVTDWKYLSGGQTAVLGWVVGITMASLACALFFNLMFVRRMIGFIVRVVGAMRRVERGDLSVRVPIAGNDETVILAKGFNSLVERVSELLNDVTKEQLRKRKAEMMLLQAQIKPHFLFNALESINILAVQNEGRKVSKMVQRLANIFRISIQQREVIRIDQELEHLRSYLEIQKFRFEDLFEFEIEVPEELLGYEILKLTLQPLVENSIQHGFEGIDYLGRIKVSAKEEGGNIAFFVEDNGIGIPQERLSYFSASGMTSLERMYEESPETGERRGLGVGNVADRLRIHYGPGYGLLLCSSPGQGTVIKCLIPKIAGGRTNEAEGSAGR
ncbi:cache domain-containing sensor histidine kinase [Cohnella lubricantis]|uniref:histidine kinase n=1 Tax=Cohnella lubricantis TaxID=2163172 RepID=A0A841TEW8_9BACL|nr:sensor histidine kinase [Cohnella lubricantis]MBB6679572.1 sensor histidine kinase [Cohnella lubricantis]MBP2120582.1 sensor histidine kinase YesM [Cohnella lubricantis]